MVEIRTLTKVNFINYIQRETAYGLNVDKDFLPLVFKAEQSARDITVDELEEVTRLFIKHSNISKKFIDENEHCRDDDKLIIMCVMSEIFDNCCSVSFGQRLYIREQ